jgi:hypothetical protein
MSILKIVGVKFLSRGTSALNMLRHDIIVRNIMILPMSQLWLVYVIEQSMHSDWSGFRIGKPKLGRQSHVPTRHGFTIQSGRLAAWC